MHPLSSCTVHKLYEQGAGRPTTVGFDALMEEHLELSAAPPQTSAIAQNLQHRLNQQVQKTLGAKTENELRFNHLHGWTSGSDLRLDLWVMMLFKLLRHQWEGDLLSALTLTASGCRRTPRCSDWRFKSSVPFPPTPLLPHPFFKHYMAQQRVDRAISYPPELVFLLS